MSMRTRNGKIARLSREVREELNQRLERAEPSPQLLAWLNALPEVKELSQAHFDGEPISKQNLSQWRQGGYQEWLARQTLLNAVRNMDDFTSDLEEGEPTEMVDKLAVVLTARFASLLMEGDGEGADFEKKAKIWSGLCRSVVQLQKTMHWACRDNLETEELVEKQHKEETKEAKSKLLRPVFDSLKLPTMAKAFGGGTLGTKIAKYIMAIQGDRFDSPDAQLDVLPTDTLGESESAPGESQSVKASNTDVKTPAPLP